MARLSAGTTLTASNFAGSTLAGKAAASAFIFFVGGEILGEASFNFRVGALLSMGNGVSLTSGRIAVFGFFPSSLMTLTGVGGGGFCAGGGDIAGCRADVEAGGNVAGTATEDLRAAGAVGVTSEIVRGLWAGAAGAGVGVFPATGCGAGASEAKGATVVVSTEMTGGFAEMGTDVSDGVTDNFEVDVESGIDTDGEVTAAG